MSGTGGDERRCGLRWIARLLRADLSAEDSEDLEVAGVVALDLQALDLEVDAAAPAVGAVAHRQSAIRMRPRRFRTWKL